MSITQVLTELCASIGAPTAVVVLALAVASRFYGLFLREGIAQRCLIVFLHEAPCLPTKLLNEVRFYPDNVPIALSEGKGLPQQVVGFVDDLVLCRFTPSLAALRTLSDIANSIGSNMARQPAYRSVIAVTVESLPEELTPYPVIAVAMKDMPPLTGLLSTLLHSMESSVQFAEDRVHDVLGNFAGSHSPDTEWLYAALHFAASFAEDPIVCEAEWFEVLKRALKRSEELLETEGISQLFIEQLYDFCDDRRGIIHPLSSQLNEIREAKEEIFYTDDYYYVPDEIFFEVCRKIPGILLAQINRALANDGIQATETCGGKVKYTQGRYLHVMGDRLRKFRFHKLKRSEVDGDSFETLLWVSNGGAGR